MIDRLPSRLLRLEGLAVLASALALYFDQGFGWLLLVVLFLAPDLSIAAYLGGPAAGALVYDLVHTYAFPLALAVGGVLASSDIAMQLALVWLAHIGLDRAIGLGLKYPTAAFKDTHLQRV